MLSSLLKRLVAFLFIFLLATPLNAEQLAKKWQDRRDYYNKLSDQACAGDKNAYDKLLSDATEKQDPVAQHDLAWLYAAKSCQYSQKDPVKYLTLFQDSAKAGYPIAQTSFAEYLMEGKEIQSHPKVAMHYLQLAINSRYGNAAATLGLYYTSGKFLPMNRNEARTLYERASKDGADPKQLAKLTDGLARLDKLADDIRNTGSTKN